MSSLNASGGEEAADVSEPYKTWLCVICGLIYSERDGWPDDGIPAGTRWADVADDWTCPECGAGKSDFEMQEIESLPPDHGRGVGAPN